MKTVHSFDDGDVVVGSTSLNTVIWTRIDGDWYNIAMGYSDMTDQRMGDLVRNSTDQSGCTWHFVGNLYHSTPWEDCDQFTTSFYED